MEPDERRRAWQKAWEIHSTIFATLPGAEALIGLYGRIPSFHDGEVERVQLNKRGESNIRISIGFPDHFANRGNVFVTLEIAQIVEVEINGFSPQNVLQELWLRPAVERPERKNEYWRRLDHEDLEIELESIYGIGGTIIGRGLRLNWSKDRRAKMR